MPLLLDLWWAYRLRWKRRKALWRAIQARHHLTPLQDRTRTITPGDILAVATVRNERLRLPDFLDHYRTLGVDHFLIVMHDSTDESLSLLEGQPDISLWSSTGSYRETRFGLDWQNWLLSRYGAGHWCLTVDADELLIYPHWTTHSLRALTDHLDETGVEAMGALMLDLYPKGPLGRKPEQPLEWFDAGPYRRVVQYPKWNRWVQGGPRDRVFFPDEPDRAPTMNKLPLVRWRRRYAYTNSTHAALPRKLNRAYDGPGDTRLSGVLLHTKFMSDCADRAREEKARREHFSQPEQFDHYYDTIIAGPDLWHSGSQKLAGWNQLVDLKLMSAGGWQPDPSMSEK